MFFPCPNWNGWSRDREGERERESALKWSKSPFWFIFSVFIPFLVQFKWRTIYRLNSNPNPSTEKGTHALYLEWIPFVWLAVVLSLAYLMERKGGQDPFNLEFSRVSSVFPFPSLFASFRPIQQLADLAGGALWSSLVAFCLLGRFKSPAEAEEEKETVLFSVSI